MIRPLALAFALATLPSALLSAAIHAGPERAVPPPGLGIASGSQLEVSMATSGQETLVAWIDGTRGRTGAYVAALSPEATLIAGSQRWLARDAFDVTITWTGHEYLVLWKDPLGLVASTLDRDLSTLVAPHLVLGQVSAVTNVAWAGDKGMLIYTWDLRTYAAIIDRQGTVIQSGIPISTQLVHDARAASDGTSFFVFWRHRDPVEHTIDTVSVARYAIDGTSLGTIPVPLPAGAVFHESWDVAFDGQRFAVVLAQRTGAAGTTLQRIVIDSDTLEPTVFAPLALGDAGAIGVEWNGMYFVASWMHHLDARTHELRTMTFSAFSFDGAPTRILGPLNPAVDADSVWNGRTLVVAWTSRDPIFTETDILATAASDGGHRKAIAVSLSHGWQTRTAIATNGNESLMVWIDGTAGNTEPRRIVSAHATGGVVDRAPRRHSETAMDEQPVVVFTGTMYLLVVNEIQPGTRTARIVLHRLDRTGTPLDPAPIHVSYGMGFGAAWNGTHLLVAYHSQGDIDAVRIAHDGTIVDSTPSKIVLERLPNEMSMASNGTDFLLVWNEGVDFGRPTPGQIDVHAVAISAAGNRIGGPIDVASGPSNQHLPAVASDGRDYVVAYFQDQTVAAKKVMREGRLASTTAHENGALVGQAPFYYTRPAIAATPNGFLVAWERELPDAAGELWLARLDSAGAVAEAAVPVVRSNRFQMLPTLTSVDGGAVDLAYSRLVDDATYGATMRVFIRRIEDGPDRRRSVRH